jgi:hypothetical protein
MPRASPLSYYCEAFMILKQNIELEYRLDAIRLDGDLGDD